jgi:hypothetical protein
LDDRDRNDRQARPLVDLLLTEAPSFCTASIVGDTFTSIEKMIEAEMYGMIPSEKIASDRSRPRERAHQPEQRSLIRCWSRNSGLIPGDRDVEAHAVREQESERRQDLLTRLGDLEQL